MLNIKTLCSRANDYEWDKKEEELPGFKIINGCSPIILSAPHSLSHTRTNRKTGKKEILPGEVYTKAIVILLHELTNCHIIYHTEKLDCDPNYDAFENNPYQQQLAEYIKENKIKVLLDIHGCSFNYKNDIELGIPVIDKDSNLTSLKGNEYIKDVIVDSLQAEFNTKEIKPRIAVNEKFPASKNNTIAKIMALKTEVSSMQLEINRAYRNPNNKDLNGQKDNLAQEKFYCLVNALVSSVKQISDIIEASDEGRKHE